MHVVSILYPCYLLLLYSSPMGMQNAWHDNSLPTVCYLLWQCFQLMHAWYVNYLPLLSIVAVFPAHGWGDKMHVMTILYLCSLLLQCSRPVVMRGDNLRRAAAFSWIILHLILRYTKQKWPHRYFKLFNC